MKYFEGFYVKCVGKSNSIAVIFGRNCFEKNNSSFIQIITDDKTYSVFYEKTDFIFEYNPFKAKVENSCVDERGLFLDIDEENFAAKGRVEFGEFAKIKYDAMGPLKFWPKMECKHCVVSMKHSLKGRIILNDKEYIFDGGVGYIEGDRGKSFPKKYFWSQCNSFESNADNLSICTSAAIIPYAGIKFMGTISVVHFNGKEHRFATYLGAKVKQIDEKKLVIKQGKKRLEVEVLDDKIPLPLHAPDSGQMTRTILESLSRKVRYKMTKGKEVLFEVSSDIASHEYSSI
ncbi:MAG: hypothetical protein FWE22_08330 [Firmicutes bacterium]|nr:hypothetical protein [Bacillota bacterium]